MRARNLAVVAWLCASASVYAATDTVSTSGTYTATTPASAWTAPNGHWTISFNVASSPVVNSSIAGTDFDVPITNFVYTLNGTPVNVGAVDVAFFSTAAGGLMNIAMFGGSALGPLSGFVIIGPQVYSGHESAPTFVLNSYAETVNTVLVAGLGGAAQPLGTVTISAALATTPIPSTLILMLAALGFVVAFLASRRWVRA
jgi:hypothetical protein